MIRPLSVLALAAAAVLMPGVAHAQAGSSSQAPGCDVVSASLEWGFKESFRGYIDGSIANGEWTVAEGAAYEQLQQPGIETELLHALRADLHERWERRDDLDAPSPELPLYIGGVHYYDPVLERKELSALAGDVAAILEDRATPKEAAAYKQFVMDTATAVAYASKEGGGFRGFGRKNQSDRELSMLDTLSAALGIA